MLRRREREEVELLENSEYGNTDLNAIISGDRNFIMKNKSLWRDGILRSRSSMNEELVDVEDDQNDAQTDDFMDDLMIAFLMKNKRKERANARRNE